MGANPFLTFLRGIAQIRNTNKKDIVFNFSTTAGVCEQVSTADSDTILDGNCDHNISQFIECDGNLASKNIPKVLVNGVANQIHTFGFCTLTPLHLILGIQLIGIVRLLI